MIDKHRHHISVHEAFAILCELVPAGAEIRVQEHVTTRGDKIAGCGHVTITVEGRTISWTKGTLVEVMAEIREAMKPGSRVASWAREIDECAKAIKETVRLSKTPEVLRENQRDQIMAVQRSGVMQADVAARTLKAIMGPNSLVLTDVKETTDAIKDPSGGYSPDDDHQGADEDASREPRLEAQPDDARQPSDR